MISPAAVTAVTETQIAQTYNLQRLQKVDGCTHLLKLLNQAVRNAQLVGRGRLQGVFCGNPLPNTAHRESTQLRGALLAEE